MTPQQKPTAEYVVTQNEDGTWSVCLGEDVLLSGVSNERAHAWIDRNRARPIWKRAKADWWGR